MEEEPFDWADPEARMRSPILTVRLGDGSVENLHWGNTELYAFLGGIANHVYFQTSDGQKLAIYDNPDLFEELRAMNYPYRFLPIVSPTESDNAVLRFHSELDRFIDS